VVGVEVYGAAVDARFDAVLGARDDGGLAGGGISALRAATSIGLATGGGTLS